jgi:hypothetical protein
MWIAAYVDDILLATSREDLRQQVIAELEKVYGSLKVQDGAAFVYRGIQITHLENGISIDQNHYVTEMLQDESGTDTAEIPLPRELPPRSRTQDGAICVEKDLYVAKVAKLGWLAHATRPDLAFATSVLAQRQVCPTEIDHKLLQQTIAYLRAHPTMCISYSASSDTLIATSDASHASDSADCRGQLGVAIFFGGAAIAAISRKIQVIFKSSMESELDALDAARNEVNVAREMLEDLGFQFDAITCYVDNLPAINLVLKGRPTKRARHVDIRLLTVHQDIIAGRITVKHLRTESMNADVLTKQLPRQSFLQHIGTLTGRERFSEIVQKNSLENDLVSGGGVLE